MGANKRKAGKSLKPTLPWKQGQDPPRSIEQTGRVWLFNKVMVDPTAGTYAKGLAQRKTRLTAFERLIQKQGRFIR